MSYKDEYKKWLELADENTKAELAKIKDEGEIRERFYRNLEFGTGGLRGIIGAGTNRINNHVVARASYGLAQYIKKQTKNIALEKVVIAYDSRNFSKEFAMTAAKVISSNGIKTFIFDELRPTPELSFAVRHLGATAGIVVTASHNPAKYNGYKIYWSDGGQIPPDIAEKILSEINAVDYFEFNTEGNDKLIEIIGEEVDKAYIESVYAQSINKDVKKDKFKLVYTPLHGSGNKLVRRILKTSGFNDVLIVKEQELPDGDFPTVASPNPENKECFSYAIELAKKNDVDLIIGTDPDCDRMGIVVKNKDGEYVPMTGNQVGVMIMDYILQHSSDVKNGAVVTTIVSTRMAKTVADYYNVKLFETLTGFKFIGEKIYEFEQSGDYTFLFGFEESYGLLAGTYCRDKDAVIASMLIAEMAAFYAEKGMTLYDVMNSLYEKFGGFYEELVSITLEGEAGLEKIKSIMKNLRENPFDELGGVKVKAVTDYLGETDLPKSDVLRFEFDNGLTIVIRPSGTEPKIKIYYLCEGESFESAKQKTQGMKRIAENSIFS